MKFLQASSFSALLSQFYTMSNFSICDLFQSPDSSDLVSTCIICTEIMQKLSFIESGTAFPQYLGHRHVGTISRLPVDVAANTPLLSLLSRLSPPLLLVCQESGLAVLYHFCPLTRSPVANGTCRPLGRLEWGASLPPSGVTPRNLASCCHLETSSTDGWWRLAPRLINSHCNTAARR